MPIICRLLGLSPSDAATLVAEPTLLAERVAKARAHSHAEAMDLADVYPATWQAWDEDSDPLGQMLEHYFFLLQQFVSRCACAGDALLLHFEAMDEGSV